MITTSRLGVPLIAISGVKNTGKTTLITHVIPFLKDRGLRVGVLKHDGHAFEPDIPEKDSHRIRSAGAELTAILDQNRYMLIAERPHTSIEAVLDRFDNMDIILLEGFKHEPYQKLELVRSAVCAGPGLDPAAVIAICADIPIPQSSVPVFDLDAYEQIADFLFDRAALCRR